MKRKVLSVILSAAMVSGILAGCGSSSTTSSTAAADSTAAASSTAAVESTVESTAEESTVESAAEETVESEAAESTAESTAAAATDGIAAPDTSDWTEDDKIYAYSWDDDFGKKLDVVLEAYPEYKDYVEYVNLGVASEESLELIDTALESGDKYPSLIPADIGSAKYYTEDDDKTLDLYSIGFTEDMIADNYDYMKEYATYNGELKAVTWQSTAGSVFYRRDIAKEVLGSDDPETVQAALADWDTFNATAQTLKDAGYSIVSCPKDVYYAIINAHTSPWVTVDADGNETFTPDDSITQFLEEAKVLYDGGFTATTSTANDMWGSDWANNMTDDGTVFCYFGCPWFIGSMQGNGATDGNWGAVVGPQSYYWGGTYVSVGKDTNNPELCAFLLYELACDPDIGVNITNETGDAVSNKTANERLVNGEISDDNNGVAFLGGQNPYETWAAAAEGIDQSAVTYQDKNYESIIAGVADGYNTGTYATIDEALDEIKSESDTTLGIPAAE